MTTCLAYQGLIFSFHICHANELLYTVFAFYCESYYIILLRLIAVSIIYFILLDFWL